jgi:hypothetical protein
MQKTPFEIGSCYSCNQGNVCIAQTVPSGVPFIVCEECFTEWPDPQSFLAMKNATFETHGRYEYMNREQVLQHPWKEFVLNKTDLEN